MKSKTNNKSKSFEYKIEDLYQSQNYYINHLFDLYGSDKGSLNDKIKKPYPWNAHTYGSYYSKLFENWNAIRTEKYNIKRSHYRFRSYSRTRKSLSYFAKKITNEMRIICKKEGKKPLVLFGNGTFKPGGTGQASMPRKPFIRELAVRYPVIITNEFNTSKLHPLNFEDLKDISPTKANERLRMCQTSNSGNSEVDILIAKKRDRDTFGSCSLMQKGFYTLIGNPIIHLQR